MAHFKGGCLCGAIRYEVTADPIASGMCHCRDCQYVGSLDDPSGFKPQGNIWVSSAQPWAYIDPALPRFEKDPPS